MADTYDLASIDLPRMKGAPLKALAAMVEKPGVGTAIRAQMLQNLGFAQFRTTAATMPPAPQPPLPHHLNDATAPTLDLKTVAHADPSPESGSFRFPSVSDFQHAYETERTNPLAVVERFFGVTEESERNEPALRVFIRIEKDDARAQAEASTRRWKDGAPLSILDGVPIAIKDEVDQVGYPTTAGTSFLGAEGVKREDATTVAKLRAAGAILVGKTNMHELGIGVTGLNPHHGAVRNPYDPMCLTGGSSSGSAAAVASGLTPIALGADGGGSIRIPAALCGVVGIKPTWSRISEHGAYPLCWSVAHLGPIANNARDCAVMYGVLAGEDEHDANTLERPPVDLNDVTRTDLEGVTFGIFDAWFNDADDAVVQSCRAAVEALTERGAKVVPISLPGLEAARMAHLVTIVSEMAASQSLNYERHAKEYALDTRLNLALARGLTAVDYVHAQRHRAHTSATFADALTRVDAILTPATACVAEQLPKDALEDGESNLRLASRIMRYSGPANLTGLPAISFPVGYDDNGMPIGMQAIGRPFAESLLFRIAHVAETFVQRRRPRFFRTLLPDDATATEKSA